MSSRKGGGDKEARGVAEEDIAQAIKTYIVGQFMPEQPHAVIDDEDQLFQRGIIDSLGIFMLLAFLQERFQVEIQPEDVVLENFETVRAITRLIAARRAS
jgi:acyl carrier protein